MEYLTASSEVIPIFSGPKLSQMHQTFITWNLDAMYQVKGERFLEPQKNVSLNYFMLFISFFRNQMLLSLDMALF